MNKYNAIEILYVEDNPADAELTMRALRARNLANQLHLVRDGEEAIDFLEGRGKYEGRDPENMPRLMLLDLKLPKVDGLEVLRHIRSDPRTKKLPVVIMTSSREGRDLVEAYELGVNSYIVKPLDFDEFAKIVGDLGLYWMLVNQVPEGSIE